MKYSKKTPFDDLILKIHNEIWSNHSNNKELVFIVEQLRTLKVNYLMMLEFDSTKIKIQTSSKKQLLVMRVSDGAHLGIIVSYLGYYYFINSLKVFADCLDKYSFLKKEQFPKYDLIHIFRNKVVIHWDDYIKNIGAGSLMMKFGETPVPCVFDGSIPQTKYGANIKIIRQILKNNQYEINLDFFTWPKDTLFLHKKKYHETLNNGILKVSKNNDGKIPSSLINALFLVGYPLPILDVSSYSKQITMQLEKLLYKRKFLNDKNKGRKNIWHPYICTINQLTNK